LSLRYWLCLLFLVGSVYGCGDKGGKNTDAGDDGGGDGATDASVCGDDICSADESFADCPADCEPVAECANGTREGDEQCDDGNSVDGDGCDADCTYSCTSDADCAVEDVCLVSPTCNLDTHA